MISKKYPNFWKEDINSIASSTPKDEKSFKRIPESMKNEISSITATQSKRPLKLS